MIRHVTVAGDDPCHLLNQLCLKQRSEKDIRNIHMDDHTSFNTVISFKFPIPATSHLYCHRWCIVFPKQYCD